MIPEAFTLIGLRVLAADLALFLVVAFAVFRLVVGRRRWFSALK
jgi:hypothetical protein